MPGYTELIKNFDKIRDFVRDFFVFGIRGRSDFANISERSYDNERRRIQSYLSDYIDENRSGSSKTISISSDTTAKTINPLFKVWETKSFTKKDLFLHFVILDILRGQCLSAPQIAEVITDEYTSMLDSGFSVDVMTVRNKLKEYSALGLISEVKQGRSVCYQLNEDGIDLQTLSDALMFYQNILPAGFLAAPVIRSQNSSYIYRQIFFAQTLDDEIVLKILQAIAQKQTITIKQSVKGRRVWLHQVVPIHIRSNARTGRQYLVCLGHKRQRYSKIRIDYIQSVTLGEPLNGFDGIRERCASSYEKSFSLENQQRDLKQVRLVLRIDEQGEPYVLDRLKREGRHGVITRLTENTFEYAIEVSDTLEMGPWLRTFIGRIVSLEGTETSVIKMFKNDIKTMMTMAGDTDV